MVVVLLLCLPIAAYGAYKKAAQQLVGQKVMTVATGAFAAQM